MCVFNKAELKEVINWHVNNTKQNFVAPDQIILRRLNSRLHGEIKYW